MIWKGTALRNTSVCYNSCRKLFWFEWDWIVRTYFLLSGIGGRIGRSKTQIIIPDTAANIENKAICFSHRLSDFLIRVEWDAILNAGLVWIENYSNIVCVFAGRNSWAGACWRPRQKDLHKIYNQNSTAVGQKWTLLTVNGWTMGEWKVCKYIY